MSRFIKLTTLVLNIDYVRKITIQPKIYTIHLVNRDIFGHIGLCYGSGYGMISSSSGEIEVCETKHPIDYKIVTEWLNKIE